MEENKIGKNIAALRKQKGFTQVQLAEKLFVSDKAVSRWESGAGLPELANLVELSKVFEVTVDELISNESILKTNTKNNTNEKTINDESLNEFKHKQDDTKKTCAQEPTKPNVYAIVSLSLSALSIIVSLFVSALLGLVMVIVAFIMAKNESKKENLSLNTVSMLQISNILCIIGVIISVIMLIVSIIFLIITGSSMSNAFDMFRNILDKFSDMINQFNLPFNITL